MIYNLQRHDSHKTKLNLYNIVQLIGAENPVLLSAAEQIFGAGGKRLRPALVFLVSRATAQLAGLKYVFSLLIITSPAGILYKQDVQYSGFLIMPSLEMAGS